jgi:hypothetical protein
MAGLDGPRGDSSTRLRCRCRRAGWALVRLILGFFFIDVPFDQAVAAAAARAIGQAVADSVVARHPIVFGCVIGPVSAVAGASITYSLLARLGLGAAAVRAAKTTGRFLGTGTLALGGATLLSEAAVRVQTGLYVDSCGCALAGLLALLASVNTGAGLGLWRPIRRDTTATIAGSSCCFGAGALCTAAAARTWPVQPRAAAILGAAGLLGIATSLELAGQHLQACPRNK